MRGPTPTATYRFQLTPSFGFDRAAAQLDRLQRLGISHVYLSPVTEAVPGQHPRLRRRRPRPVRDELGGLDGLTALLDACAGRGMGVVIDHVPNHTAVGRPELNARWWAMLRDGPDERGGAVVRRRLGGGRREGHPAGARRAARRRRRRPHDRRRRAAPRRRSAGRWRPAPSGWRRRTRSRASTTGCSGGGTRRATCGGSSRSTTSSACASRIPSSPPSSTPCRGCSPTTRRSPASASTTSTGSPTRSATSRGCGPRSATAGCSSRRSSPPTRRCRGRGRSTARRATSTPRSSSTPCSTGTGWAALRERWVAITGDDRPFRAWELEARREVLDGGLRPDLERAARVPGWPTPRPSPS